MNSCVLAKKVLRKVTLTLVFVFAPPSSARFVHSVHGTGVDAWMDTLLLPAQPHSYTYSNVGLNPRDSVI